jgi:hypothetical protein
VQPGTRNGSNRPAETVETPFDDSAGRDGRPEFLVLDIGGDVGALVLYADEECLGREIDLTPAGTARSHHTHTMIRRRRAPDRELVVGVYAELTAGSYTAWGLDGEPIADVTIRGGQVSELHAGDCRLPPIADHRILTHEIHPHL